MDLRDSFQEWLSLEIGSNAVPALRQYLRDRDYRLLSIVEHNSRWQRDVYHPDRGFYRAIGEDDQEALLGILRQIWLVDALIPVSSS
jgi:hypothetical protein